jgi:hypothetical protein
MKVYIYPHGEEVQRHFEELSAEGVPWSKASESSSRVQLEWPDTLRLPVPGDVIDYDWVSGRVRTVTFLFDPERIIPVLSEVRIKLEH